MPPFFPNTFTLRERIICVIFFKNFKPIQYLGKVGAIVYLDFSLREENNFFIIIMSQYNS